ncbi:hypothetical protein ACFU8I_01400 [Streptomyces sp. NPDC057540]|uniref:hypothetical protein n=1 Tax=Streptomyces sp. NPDC057540 TaxID=3346160 RepID=UPI0036B051DE
MQPAPAGGDGPANDEVSDSDADHIACAPLLWGQQKATMCLHGFSKPAEVERELVFTEGHDEGRTFLEVVLHHSSPEDAAHRTWQGRPTSSIITMTGSSGDASIRIFSSASVLIVHV